MNTKKAALAVFLSFAVPPLFAASDGTSVAPFLSIEQGARAIGMGGAFSAVADDSNSMWWNPAGLSHVKLREASASHTTLYDDISTQFGTVAYPLRQGKGTIGVSYTYYNISNIESTDAAGASGGNLTANGYAASVAYGVKLGEMFSAGVTGKAIGQKLDTENGNSFATDLGIQLRQGKFRMGYAFYNLGPDFNFAGVDQPLPWAMRGGAAYQIHPRALVAADIAKARFGDVKFHLGGEFEASEVFKLRAGYAHTPELGTGAGVSLGLTYTTMFGAPAGWAGGDTPWWERNSEQMKRPKPKGAYYVFLDYGFVNSGKFTDTHRITMGMKF